MKKTRVIILVIFIIQYVLLSTRVCGSLEPSVKIGNEVLNLKNYMRIYDDKIYISIRSLSEKLGIPIKWNEETKQAHMDIYKKNIGVSDKTTLKEDGVIPDEETAYIVGKKILERYSGKELEYETSDKKYYLKVAYSVETNSWEIAQWFDYKDGSKWIAGGNLYIPKVIINKNSGEVLYINTYSSFESR